MVGDSLIIKQTTSRVWSQIREDVSTWWQRDRWPLTTFFVLLVLRLQPGILRTFQRDWMLVGFTDNDTYIKLWDYWLFTEAGTPFDRMTDLLLYPVGVDLSLHNLNYVQMILMLPFEPLLGLLPAFNLMIIISLLLNGYITYLLAYHLTNGHRAAAVVAGAFVAFSPWSIGKTAQPETMMLFIISLTLLLFFKAIECGNILYAVGAGLSLGTLTMISLYYVVIMFVMMALIVPVLATKRWRELHFWRVLVVMLLVGVPLMLIRLYPFISDPSIVDAAAAKFDSLNKAYVRAFVIPIGNPLVIAAGDPGNILQRGIKNDVLFFYMGLLPTILILAGTVFGISNGEKRLTIIGWVMLSLWFIWLSMGDTITWVRGVPPSYFPSIRPFIADTLPFITQGFAAPLHFFIGVPVPFAIALALSTAPLIDRFEETKRLWVGIGLAALVTLELATGIFNGRHITPPGRSADYFAAFKAIERSDVPGAVLSLPMGRIESKMYNYTQLLHGRPLVEGALARDDPTARSFIRSNALLQAWAPLEPLSCQEAEFDQQAIEQLIAEDIGLITVDRIDRRAAVLLVYFGGVEPIIATDEVLVFAVEDLLREPLCAESP